MGEVEEVEGHGAGAGAGIEPNLIAELPGPLQADAQLQTAAERPKWLTSAAINGFSACLALATIALLFGPLRGTGPVRLLVPQWQMFAIFIALWVAALWAPVELHYRGNTTAIELDAVPLSVGLVFLSPTLLELGCVAGAVFVFTAVYRQRPTKLFFNVASHAICAAVAAVTFRAILGGHSPVSLRGWAALTVALFAREIIVTINLGTVTRLAGQTAERRTGSRFVTQAMFFASSTCLAIVVLDALWFSLRAMVPLVLVAAMIIVAYRGYTRLTLRFASLQRLYDFSRALGTTNLDPSSMSVEVLRQVCTVMRARRAQLVLAEPSGIPRRISLDDHGPSGVEPIGLDGASFVTRCIDSGLASLHVGPNAHATHALRPCGRQVHGCSRRSDHGSERGHRGHRRARP